MKSAHFALSAFQSKFCVNREKLVSVTGPEFVTIIIASFSDPLTIVNKCSGKRQSQPQCDSVLSQPAGVRTF